MKFLIDEMPKNMRECMFYKKEVTSYRVTLEEDAERIDHRCDFMHDNYRDCTLNDKNGCPFLKALN